MVVVSSVTASIIGRAMLGNHPFLHLPTFQVTHVVQYPLFAVLALVAGVVGVIFSRVLYGVEDACDWAWRGPEWARPAVGGILLGLLLLLLPEMYGVGYPVLGNAVAGHYTVLFLLALLVGKLAACSLTIGIGGSGGVFAPSLFCGAMLGAAFGGGVHALMPATGGSIGAYALVGMGAVFAGAARAPITAAVIMFELTGEYTIILPLMLAVVVATAISSVISADTVYTRKLLRRGIDIDEPADAKLRRRPITALMVAPPTAVRPDADLAAVAGLYAGRTDATLPVVDDDGRYLGTLTSYDVLDALAAADPTDVVALTINTTPVGETASFGDILRRFDSGVDAVPVADSNGALIGWVRQRDILAALAPTDPGPAPRRTPSPTSDVTPTPASARSPQPTDA
jgi:CIC family chloride channel protein